MGLLLQRDKSPSWLGGEAAGDSSRLQRQAGIREWTGSRQGFSVPEPMPTGVLPPARLCYLTLPRQYHHGRWCDGKPATVEDISHSNPHRSMSLPPLGAKNCFIRSQSIRWPNQIRLWGRIQDFVLGVIEPSNSRQMSSNLLHGNAGWCLYLSYLQQQAA